MATATPDNEFQPRIGPSMIQDSDLSLSNRGRSESFPPTIVPREQLNTTTNANKKPTLNSRRNNARLSKYSSQSFTSMKTVDELEQEDQKRTNPQPVKANVTRIRRFPSHHVPWIKEDSTQSPLQRIRSESLPASPIAGGKVRIPLEHLPMERVTSSNDRQEPPLQFYPEDVRSARYSSQSFSSLKKVDEKEERDQSAKINRPKRNSIYSLVQLPRYGTQGSATIFGNKINSPTKYLHTGDLTPLDPITDENPQSKLDSHLVKYNFQSSNVTTTIYGKQEENVQLSEKNRRSAL
jgi:hypothetical protein